MSNRPDWLKVRIPSGENYFEVRRIRQYLLQQRRMGYHTALFFAGSRLCLKHA